MEHLTHEEIFDLAQRILVREPFSPREEQDLAHIGQCEPCYRLLRTMLEVMEAVERAPELSRLSGQEEAPGDTAVIQLVVLNMAGALEQLQYAGNAWTFQAPPPVRPRGQAAPSPVKRLTDRDDAQTYLAYDPVGQVLTIQLSRDSSEAIPQVMLCAENAEPRELPLEIRGRFLWAEVHGLPEGRYQIILQK